MLALAQNVILSVLPWLFVLTLIVTVHELGHFLVARWCGVAVDRFSIGFGRAILRWQDRSGVEWRLGWIPLGGYVKFAGDAEASSSVPDAEALEDFRQQVTAREGAGAERRFFHFKPIWQRMLVVVAGPFANFLLSTVIFAGLLLAFGSIVHVPRVQTVLPGSAAQQAGFKPGDVITAVDGRRISDFTDVQSYVSLRSGTPITFLVTRDRIPVALTATPRRGVVANPIAGKASVGVLGLIASDRREDVYHKSYGPIEALGGGVAQTWKVLDTTLFYISRIFRGAESGDQLGGPLRTLTVTHNAAAIGAEGAHSLGSALFGSVINLINVAGFISVGIGFVNLLPVPVLDGGHLLFYAYEAIARRPLGARVQAAGYRVGLAMLLGLMVFATWNDLQQLSVFKFIGGLFS